MSRIPLNLTRNKDEDTKKTDSTQKAASNAEIFARVAEKTAERMQRDDEEREAAKVENDYFKGTVYFSDDKISLTSDDSGISTTTIKVDTIGSGQPIGVKLNVDADGTVVPPSYPNYDCQPGVIKQKEGDPPNWGKDDYKDYGFDDDSVLAADWDTYPEPEDPVEVKHIPHRHDTFRGKPISRETARRLSSEGRYGTPYPTKKKKKKKRQARPVSVKRVTSPIHPAMIEKPKPITYRRVHRSKATNCRLILERSSKKQLSRLKSGYRVYSKAPKSEKSLDTYKEYIIICKEFKETGETKIGFKSCSAYLDGNERWIANKTERWFSFDVNELHRMFREDALMLLQVAKDPIKVLKSKKAKAAQKKKSNIGMLYGERMSGYITGKDKTSKSIASSAREHFQRLNAYKPTTNKGRK